MSVLTGRTKRAVLGGVAVALVPWALLIGVVSSLVAGRIVGLVVGVVLAPPLVLLFPERRVAEYVFASLTRKATAVADGRLRNIADGLALAIGVPAEQVQLIASPVPNVIALPTRSHGLVVVATDGAVRLLSRQELEALVASQIVVAGDRWVRLATRAQLAQAPWAVLLAATMAVGLAGMLFFILAMVVLFLFAFTTLPRRADAVRDLVADGVAIHTTKNPAALVSALRTLRPAALVAPEQRLGVGMLVDPFAVLSVRMKVATTVTTNGRSRSWTTAEEVATELGFRADRMERVVQGDSTADETLGPFRKAWSALGRADNAYRLSPWEQAAGENARTAWRSNAN